MAMATAPPQEEELPILLVTRRSYSLRYANANVSIRDLNCFYSVDDGVGDVQDDVSMRVWIAVYTPAREPPAQSRPLIRWERIGICYNTSMSLLTQHRGFIEGLFGRRPDVDDIVDFLMHSIGLYARDFVERLASAPAVSAYHRTVRARVIEFEVRVFLDETDADRRVVRRRPEAKLKKVVYEGGEGSAAAAVHETACPICLQDFVAGEVVDVTLCEHPFHPQCLGRWLEQKGSCPLCRSELGNNT